MSGSMGGGAVADADPAAGDALARAHAGLLRQSDLQFDFAAFKPPLPPDWLKPLIELLQALAPVFKWVFWIGLALGVGAILLFVGRELLATRFPSLRRKPKVLIEPEWRPAVACARTLLEDADRLAAAGRFGEAVRLILFRSIEDIDARWPGQVRPALTSRDIAALEILPGAARGAFSGIAQVVEHSLFGGEPVDSAQFAACRGAYEAFALPEPA
jgi:hypothetical protein